MDKNKIIKPSHYEGAVEPIDLIEAIGASTGFFVGNIIKYVARFNRKDGLKDLYKAQFYLNKLIELLESQIED